MDSWTYGRGFESFDQRHELENDDDLLMSNGTFANKVGSSLEEENQSYTEQMNRIDFKLQSFYDDTTTTTTTSSKAKKARASIPSSLLPLCQVYGCNMDLSSSKDYHKRHRVCEAHSKTSVVIVSGVEQRFCQQCSRFHFLAEFDDGKRSCRRRLAGHNQRRRKPSFYFLPGKQHKLLPTSQESYPGSFLYRVIDEHDHRRSRLITFKDEPTATSMVYESKPAMYSPEASGVSSIWDLHEAAASSSCSTCALSLLSAQSQSEIQNTFSTTQPDHNFSSPLWIDHGKNDIGSSSFTGKGSSTVDLLQLSSHLRRIEQQRNFTDEVKQEYNELYFPTS